MLTFGNKISALEEKISAIENPIKDMHTMGKSMPEGSGGSSSFIILSPVTIEVDKLIKRITLIWVLIEILL